MAASGTRRYLAAEQPTDMHGFLDQAPNLYATDIGPLGCHDKKGQEKGQRERKLAEERIDC